VIIAPQLKNLDGSHQVSYHKILSVKDIIKDLLFLSYFFKSKYNLCNEDICECESLSGAALMLSKKRWLELGGFDEKLFWKEDMDLCLRNKKSGGKNYYVKSAVAKHYSGGSSDKNRDIVVANQIFSELKFFQKHSNRFTLLFVSILILLIIITRIIMYSLFFWKLSIRKRIKGYFLAIKNFFKWIFKNEQGIVT
jgi:GT2 family glycosyltransferase